jgi:N-carbamoylputrescine amidase
MNGKLPVALIQHACGDDRGENVEKSLALAADAAAQGAKLVVLQELHAGRYFCKCEDTCYFDWAETIPGPLTGQFGDAAKKLGITLVTSMFERRAAGIYHNTAVVFDRSEEIAGIYRKMHIPDDPGYYEKFYFAPGDLGFNPIDTSVGRLGVLVCWDQWFPEAARAMALRGADVLIYPTAIGYNPPDSQTEKVRQRDAWTISQRAHAVANGLPVLSVNRVGYEPDETGGTEGIQFWGESFVAGPQGEINAQATPDGEEVLMAEIDMDGVEEVRRIWPFFRDRRIDAYGDLAKRYAD